MSTPPKLYNVIEAAELRGAENMREATASRLQTEIDTLLRIAARSTEPNTSHYLVRASDIRLLRDAIRAIDPKKVLKK